MIPPPRPGEPNMQQLQKIAEMLVRLSKHVTKETGTDGVMCLRRERETGDIEYQIFADTPDGTQIAWVQSTRHDAEFIQACLAQAPLFDKLFALVPIPPEETRPSGLETSQFSSGSNDGTELLGDYECGRAYSYAEEVEKRFKPIAECGARVATESAILADLKCIIRSGHYPHIQPWTLQSSGGYVRYGFYRERWAFEALRWLDSAALGHRERDWIQGLLFGYRPDVIQQFIESQSAAGVYAAEPNESALTAALTEQARLRQEVHRLQVARIGDSEIIGRWMCQAEKAEADLLALRQERDRLQQRIAELAAKWRDEGADREGDDRSNYVAAQIDALYEHADELQALLASVGSPLLVERQETKKQDG